MRSPALGQNLVASLLIVLFWSSTAGKPISGVVAHLYFQPSSTRTLFSLPLAGSTQLKQGVLEPDADIILTVSDQAWSLTADILKQHGVEPDLASVKFRIDMVRFSDDLQWSKGHQLRPNQQESLARVQESRRDFPSAYYDESEPADPVQKTVRKEKQKRYNTLNIVSKTPHPNDAEVGIVLESPDLPAIPVGESNVVIIGEVEGAEAHLSDNKQNVFSEFTIRITEILKSPTALSPDTLITIDRNGGFVDYPNGQKVLYRFAGEKAPRVGGQYVFFLKRAGQDLQILTAYELGESGISPLDELPQFRGLKGQDAMAFLVTVRDSIKKSTPTQEQ